MGVFFADSIEDFLTELTGLVGLGGCLWWGIAKCLGGCVYEF